jgi:hypothetical protein
MNPSNPTVSHNLAAEYKCYDGDAEMERRLRIRIVVRQRLAEFGSRLKDYILKLWRVLQQRAPETLIRFLPPAFLR